MFYQIFNYRPKTISAESAIFASSKRNDNHTLMKMTFYLAIVATLCFASCKQNGVQPAGGNDAMEKELQAHDKAVLARAEIMKDPYTAIYAMNSLLVYDSTNIKYLDSLAKLYAKMGMLDQSMKLVPKVLAKKHDDVKMLEIQASGEMALGHSDKAIEISNKLYDKTNMPKYLFNIAGIQLQSHPESHDYTEIEKILAKIEANPNYLKDSASMQTDAPSQMQKVPLTAAVTYIRGVMDAQNQKYNTAMQKFEAALKIDREFYMAQKNYQYLGQAMQQEIEKRKQQQQGPK